MVGTRFARSSDRSQRTPIQLRLGRTMGGRTIEEIGIVILHRSAQLSWLFMENPSSKSPCPTDLTILDLDMGIALQNL